MNKISNLILLLFLVVHTASGRDIKSKTPPSFQYKNSLALKPRMYEALLKADAAQLRLEDMERIKDGHPLRIAVGIPADLEVNTETTPPLQLPGGERIWQQAVKSEGAQGLILTFEELYIPEGGELYAYTADRSQSEVYTHSTNPGGGAYATSLFYQDELILEYVDSGRTAGLPRIKISDIGYAYRPKSVLADDMSCYINAGCSEGDEWVLQKDGVVEISINMRDGASRGWFACSGSLINNARQDGTPFILTANHCIEGYDNTTLSTMKFDFFKESTSSNCFDQSKESPLSKVMTGAAIIADIPIGGASDGTLLRLNSSIPEDWEVYYNGWDARGIAAASGVCIHHPNEFVKKISTFNKALKPVGYIDMGDVYTGKDAHWEVTWAETTNGQSVTYEGSSGSPIFNENGHIVGTLTGGGSFCGQPNDPDYYGRFSYHWNQYADQNQHFKKYLDPDDTGILVLDGYDPHMVSFEEAPAALPASAAAAASFTANWNILDKADKYYLDVYRLNENGEPDYVDGYRMKNVGNTASFTVTGLEPETEYRYVVRAGKRVYLSEASNEITVQTSEASINYYTPVAKEAASIWADSFTAGWEPLKQAVSYQLSVYQKKGGNDGAHTVDFTSYKMPDGWETNSSSYYTSTSHSASPPALKLEKTGAYIESPQYGGKIKLIEFWYRGASAAAGSSLAISTYDGTSWKELMKIQPLSNKAATVAIAGDELPECTAVKFTYSKASGNVAIDDIKITYGEKLTIDYVPGFNGLDVGGELSHKVGGLKKNTQYYYSVKASDGTLFSKTSNEISVMTNEITAGMENAATDSYVFVDNNFIIVRRNHAVDTELRMYNAAGQLVLSMPMLQSGLQIPAEKFTKGIYFIQVGGDIHKALVK